MVWFFRKILKIFAILIFFILISWKCECGSNKASENEDDDQEEEDDYYDDEYDDHEDYYDDDDDDEDDDDEDVYDSDDEWIKSLVFRTTFYFKKFLFVKSFK